MLIEPMAALIQDRSDLLQKAHNLISERKFSEAKVILEGLIVDHMDIDANNDEEFIRVKAQAIIDLGNVMKNLRKPEELTKLIEETRPFLKLVSKSKASRLVRTLVNAFLDMNAGTGKEISLCKENIEWAKNEKRTFLRQALEVRLIALFYHNQLYEESLSMGSKILSEFKKLDDKHLLIDVHLIESKSYFALGNLSKSKTALTTARTAANAVYCPPKVQADLDMQSGVLHTSDSDFKTAFSYFYEAFDGYDSGAAASSSNFSHDCATKALKYMILCKIMTNSHSELKSIRTAKNALKYTGSEIDAIEEVAAACNAKSLAQFEEVLHKYPKELRDDVVVRFQLDSLYDELFEQNLTKLVEPFCRVEICHIAKLINRKPSEVERKLSTMILDKKLNGILDQSNGVLIIYSTENDNKGEENESLYKEGMGLISQMGKVVDMLFAKAKNVSI